MKINFGNSLFLLKISVEWISSFKSTMCKILNRSVALSILMLKREENTSFE